MPGKEYDATTLEKVAAFEAEVKRIASQNGMFDFFMERDLKKLILDSIEATGMDANTYLALMRKEFWRKFCIDRFKAEPPAPAPQGVLLH